jgi:hypothetical protein
VNWSRINRNSLAQFWRKRMPSLPRWDSAKQGTRNVGRNKAKRERKSWETAPFSEFAP